jgi:hypothetical protein
MATIEGLEAKIEALTARVTELEEERAIRELLARYGYNHDLERNEQAVNLFTEDGVIDLGGGGALMRYEGRDKIREFVNNPQGHHNPEWHGKRMHLMGNNVVCHIKGDEAVVNNYVVLLGRRGEEIKIESAGNQQTTVKKVKGKWLISERRRRHIGGEGFLDNLEATPE